MPDRTRCYMPIILVCNAELQIIWTDGNFCDVIDCERTPALGRDLFEFLNIPAESPLRPDIRALLTTAGRVRYTTQLPRVGGGRLEIELYLESVPVFEGVDGAALIAVGLYSVDPHTLKGLSGNAPGLNEGGDPLRRTYRYSNLRLDAGADLFARLERAVTEQQLHRRSDFTLEQAAAKLNTNALYLSQATNFFSGLSFPNYLNSQRLVTLKRSLRERPDASFTELWREAGFGSYSSLNRFLKSQYRISPSQFERQVRSDS